jgi:hypothetical protein
MRDRDSLEVLKHVLRYGAPTLGISQRAIFCQFRPRTREKEHVPSAEERRRNRRMSLEPWKQMLCAIITTCSLQGSAALVALEKFRAN